MPKIVVADNFSQRAVYWLASKEAMKASRVDGTLKKAAIKSSNNYEAKAPQKSEIFSSGREGRNYQNFLLDK